MDQTSCKEVSSKFICLVLFSLFNCIDIIPFFELKFNTFYSN